MRLLSAVLLVALIVNVNCWGPPCSVGPGAEDVDLASGRWELRLEPPSLTGDCQGIDAREVIEPVASAELSRLPEGWLHLDLDGVHLEGDQYEEGLWAEGADAQGFVLEDPHVAPQPVGVTLEAWLEGRDFMVGSLEIVTGATEAGCVLVFPFEASLVPGTDGSPETCNEPVPADPADPPSHPAISSEYCA